MVNDSFEHDSENFNFSNNAQHHSAQKNNTGKHCLNFKLN